MILYHGTFEEQVPAVLKYGLTPKAEPIPGLLGKFKPVAVYLTTEPKEAASFGDILLKLNIPKSWTQKNFDIRDIEEEGMLTGGHNVHEYIVTRHIPPKYIVEVLDAPGW